jgi:hypothetical protein
MRENLLSFRNKHKGDSCYLFGDGPSIRYFDYSKFSDHIAISCGNQIFHKEFDQLNVKYYSIIEPYLFVPNWLLLRRRLQYLKKHRIITNEYRKRIRERKDISFFINLSNLPFIISSNVVFSHASLIRKSSLFNCMFAKNINPFNGSFHTNLTLAMLMGFKKVYLVGYDAFTIQSSPYRWYEKSFPGLDLGRPDPFISHDFLSIYKEHMDIYNISPNGTRCNIQDLNYSDYTSAPLNYRENYELLNPVEMKLIKSTFPNA